MPVIGNISPGTLSMYGHRRKRLAEEIAAARRLTRLNPDDLGAHQELERLQATLEALHRDAALEGVRIPSRYDDPFA